MFSISVVAFVTGLIGLIGLLMLGNPMVRASELEHGLAAGRETVKKLRGERRGRQAKLGTLEAGKQELAKSLEVMRAELKTLDEKIGRLPQQSHELTFELGGPENGLQPYEFVLNRRPDYLELEKVAGPEQLLWKQPRLLRVWSRSQATAAAAAEKRYPTQSGFIIRSALRVDAAGDRPAGRG